MYILAIETTGAFASVALAEAANKRVSANERGFFKVLASVQGNDRFSHLQNLTPQIEEVVRQAGITMKDLDFIAVSKGPGSFTGIRIGVATARALAQVLGIRCVGISSLEGLALEFSKTAKISSDPDWEHTLICPMLDARRNQVYAGGYIIRPEMDEDGPTGRMIPQEVIAAGPYLAEDFVAMAESYVEVSSMTKEYTKTYCDRVAFTGEEIKGFAETETGRRILMLTCQQNADTIAEIGFAKIKVGKSVEYEELKPDYMRMAEAERKRLEAAQK